MPLSWSTFPDLPALHCQWRGTVTRSDIDAYLTRTIA